MPFNLLLEDGSPLLLESGDNLLLETGLRMYPLAILFDSAETIPDRVFEETTPAYRAKLVDENDERVSVAVLDAILVSVADKKTGIVLRHAENGLNANDLTIIDGDADTVLTFILQIEETRLVDLANSNETRELLFELAWSSADTGTANNPISTTEDSATVTLTIPGHGLTQSTGPHHIFLVPDEEVGGVCVSGSQRITEVVDADTLTVEARKVATATANGGGTVTWFTNGRVGKKQEQITVTRAEPIC
tara:strand:- start:297766 stop:298512 length:747 start_codon:yes stop_codon:yes gene_type:complete